MHLLRLETAVDRNSGRGMDTAVVYRGVRVLSHGVQTSAGILIPAPSRNTPIASREPIGSNHMANGNPVNMHRRRVILFTSFGENRLTSCLIGQAYYTMITAVCSCNSDAFSEEISLSVIR